MAKTNEKPTVKIPTEAEQKASITGEQLRAQQLLRKKAGLTETPVIKDKLTVEKYVPSEKMLAFTVIVDPLNIYKANLGFLRYDRPDFFEFTANVLTKTTDNINFPLPLPAPADIEAEIGLYNVAKAARLTSAANTHLGNVKYMMKQLAIWIANNCGNDFDKFTTSGFIANQLKPGPTKEIGQAIITGVNETLVSGNFYAIVDPVPGANFYKGYWTKPSAGFSTANPTRGGKGVRVKFIGLLKNVPVDLYVVASGPENDGDPSDPKPYTPR
jgi:hypothetical protein